MPRLRTHARGWFPGTRRLRATRSSPARTTPREIGVRRPSPSSNPSIIEASEPRQKLDDRRVLRCRNSPTLTDGRSLQAPKTRAFSPNLGTAPHWYDSCDGAPRAEVPTRKRQTRREAGTQSHGSGIQPDSRATEGMEHRKLHGDIEAFRRR